jgi:hypothetical protein
MPGTMRMIIAAMMATMMCGSADAQRYYARERLQLTTTGAAGTSPGTSPSTPSCGTLASQNGGTGGSVVAIKENATSISIAQSFCSESLAAYGAGACQWNSPAAASNGNRAFYFKGGSVAGLSQGQAASYATTCR